MNSVIPFITKLTVIETYMDGIVVFRLLHQEMRELKFQLFIPRVFLRRRDIYYTELSLGYEYGSVSPNPERFSISPHLPIRQESISV